MLLLFAVRTQACRPSPFAGKVQLGLDDQPAAVPSRRQGHYALSPQHLNTGVTFNVTLLTPAPAFTLLPPHTPQVTTVDKYQGQQNDFVLLSLVRTRVVGHLRDVRRLVVAMSRARLGLYVFGRQGLFANCYELQPAFKCVAVVVVAVRGCLAWALQEL